jgi:uncharacterized protein YqeY
MHMSLIETINNDLKDAMRSKDKVRLNAVRALRGKVIEAAKSGSGGEATDDDVVTMTKSLIKQRRQSIEEFRKGNREDLIENEVAEIAVLEAYLPPQLSEAEIAAIVAEAVDATGAATIKDMGKVMGAVKGKIAATGKDADNAIIATQVNSALGG